MTDSILNYLVSQTGETLFLPYYHVVSDKELPHIKHLYPVKSIKQFEKEIDYLLQHFEPISLQQLQAIQSAGKKPGNPSFFLSFDDGFRQCYEIIAPILLRKGVPATFFINSAFVDNQELMYRNKISLLLENGLPKDTIINHTFKQIEDIDAKAKAAGVDIPKFLQEEQPYMTLSQLKELKKQGFTIGAHSHAHPYYQHISVEEQLIQTRQSTQFVKEHFNQPISAFAFPFDDVGVESTFFNQIQPEIELFFTTGGIKQDEYSNVFRRVDMEYQNDLPAFLKKQYGKFLLKKSLGFRHIHKR